MKAVIICGGVGTKMWPESRVSSPKQFLPLVGGKSLFQLNWEVLRKKFDVKDIYVSTSVNQAEIVKRIAPEIPMDNYILEPEARNTGPAVGLIAAKLYSKYPDEAFVVVQSDILRQPDEKFLDMIDQFDELMKKSNEKWITGAIKAPFAMMGVDYMISDNESDLSDWMIGKDKEEVESYIKNGKAWLHANHYCWTPKKLLESYQRFKPEWAEPLMKIANGADEAEIYPLIPKGRTEEWTEKSVKAGEGMMMKLPFEWWDFGTWESVANYLIAKNMYSLGSNVMQIDSNNNFVRANKTVALIGVDDLVVIDREDALLICKKEMTGKVGEVVDKLKTENKVELL